jgi:hypothetical protein
MSGSYTDRGLQVYLQDNNGVQVIFEGFRPRIMSVPMGGQAPWKQSACFEGLRGCNLKYKGFSTLTDQIPGKASHVGEPCGRSPNCRSRGQRPQWNEARRGKTSSRSPRSMELPECNHVVLFASLQNIMGSLVSRGGWKKPGILSWTGHKVFFAYAEA